MVVREGMLILVDIQVHSRANGQRVQTMVTRDHPWPTCLTDILCTFQPTQSEARQNTHGDLLIPGRTGLKRIENGRETKENNVNLNARCRMFKACGTQKPVLEGDGQLPSSPLQWNPVESCGILWNTFTFEVVICTEHYNSTASRQR